MSDGAASSLLSLLSYALPPLPSLCPSSSPSVRRLSRRLGLWV